MKVIVAGSRSIKNKHKVWNIIDNSKFEITELVSGSAKGVDSVAEHWAKKGDIPINKFEPDWDEHGKAAGPIRNQEMAKYADALIAIWDGESSGTQDMIQRARSEDLQVNVHILGEDTRQSTL